MPTCRYFPEVQVAGYPTLGGSHADVRHSTLNTFPLVVTASRTLRRHFLKAGFDGAPGPRQHPRDPHARTAPFRSPPR